MILRHAAARALVVEMEIESSTKVDMSMDIECRKNLIGCINVSIKVVAGPKKHHLFKLHILIFVSKVVKKGKQKKKIKQKK